MKEKLTDKEIEELDKSLVCSNMYCSIDRSSVKELFAILDELNLKIVRK